MLQTARVRVVPPGAYVHKILSISLSAALVSARLTGTAEAAYQPEDFEQIETLIEDGNWVALRTYLNENPRILDCNDDLAAELRRFLENASGLYAALTFEDSMYPDMGLRALVPQNCIIVADTSNERDADDDDDSDRRDNARTQDRQNTAAPAAARATTAASIY